ncbi:MAG: CoA-binding protein [Dehalococcoidia bacterium]|nr:CoA-binding protein [Dehalococcoidia bacterium]
MSKIDDSFFEHSSVAIAGASAEYNIGHAFVQCLQDAGFQGPIYPLNPAGGEVRGLKVYRHIADIPGTVDYVISCIPARFTPQLVKDSAAKGARIVSFFTAGYSESGRSEGRDLELELLRVAQATDVRLLGPNCLGLYCPRIGLSFAADFPKEAGNVGFIGQSGGNAIYLIRAAGHRGVRFSKAVSYGNACDVDECDLLEYFATDNETEVVAAYIEGVKDGRRFRRVLRDLCALKPVVILKGGYTTAGAVAASSHTGSLAGTGESWEGLLNQAGAVRVYSLDEMADMLVTFSYMVPPRGRRAVICGSNGGFSVLTADDYIRAGFELPQLAPREQADLLELVAKFSSTDAGMMLRNPFDITNVTSPEGHHAIMRSLMANPGFDLLVAQVSISNSAWPFAESPYVYWPDMFLDSLLRAQRDVGKPAAVILHSICSAGEFERMARLREKCQKAGLPVYDSIPKAALAMDRFLRYHERRRRQHAETG